MVHVKQAQLILKSSFISRQIHQPSTQYSASFPTNYTRSPRSPSHFSSPIDLSTIPSFAIPSTGCIHIPYVCVCVHCSPEKSRSDATQSRDVSLVSSATYSSHIYILSFRFSRRTRAIIPVGPLSRGGDKLTLTSAMPLLLTAS